MPACARGEEAPATGYAPYRPPRPTELDPAVGSKVSKEQASSADISSAGSRPSRITRLAWGAVRKRDRGFSPTLSGYELQDEALIFIAPEKLSRLCSHRQGWSRSSGISTAGSRRQAGPFPMLYSWPIPRAPPVTIATLPLKRPGDSSRRFGYSHLPIGRGLPPFESLARQALEPVTL